MTSAMHVQEQLFQITSQSTLTVKGCQYVTLKLKLGITITVERDG